VIPIEAFQQISELNLLDPTQMPQDRSAIRKRVASFGKGVGSNLHTIVLLVAIGGSEKIGHRISQYLETGDPVYFEEVSDELSELAASTAISAELWSQILGSRAMHGIENAFVKGIDGTIGRMAGPKHAGLLSQAKKSQFLLRHAFGYIGFFGWEFGRELYRAALLDFTDTIQGDDSKVNDVDIHRAQNIWELMTDSELRTEFLTSVFYVLSQNDKLRRVFNTAARKWISWDLASTYGALALGSHVGRAAAARLGAVMGGSRFGWIGSAVGSFIGVVLFALVQEIGPIKSAIIAADRWIILRPRRRLFTRAAEVQITGLTHPSYGASFFCTS